MATWNGFCRILIWLIWFVISLWSALSIVQNGTESTRIKSVSLFYWSKFTAFCFKLAANDFFVSPIAICYLIWYSYMLYHPFLWLAEGYCIIKMLTSHNQLPVYWYESCISGVWMVRFENSPSRQMQLENRFRAFLKHHSMLWKCSIRIISGFLCGAIDFRIISIRKAMASDNNTTKSVRSIHQIYRSGLCSAHSMCLCAALSTKCISK